MFLMPRGGAAILYLCLVSNQIVSRVTVTYSRVGRAAEHNHLDPVTPGSPVLAEGETSGQTVLLALRSAYENHNEIEYLPADGGDDSDGGVGHPGSGTATGAL